MNMLDCETLESTYESIENILGITESKLKSVFDEMISVGFEDFREEFCCKIEPIPYSIDSVCWFHITRIGIDTDFSDGILPLHLGIEKIWSFLYTLADNKLSQTEWNNFKNRMINENFSSENNHCSHSQYLYKMKTENQRHGGPFAMLVKEIAFNSEMVGNHDYLKVPEIVEDIFTCFQFVYGYSLTDTFLSRTQPCIIKFVSKTVRNNLLSPTLYYLYCKNKGFELSLDCNTCFDGEGNVIHLENILQIDWLE